MDLGFSTYVFVERIAANAAALHAFPEHNIGLVRDALAQGGYEIAILGPQAPTVGEGIYFSSEPFGDSVLGELADALCRRGIGAYAYALVDSSLGPDLSDIALFTRVGSAYPLEGRHILMTRLFISHGSSPADSDASSPEGGAPLEGDTTPEARLGSEARAVTWVFGSPADLREAETALSQRFDTEPVEDPAGMAAIEVRHPEFSAGTAQPAELLDSIFQVLGHAGFEGITMCDAPQ